jgi:hypothetical protein
MKQLLSRLNRKWVYIVLLVLLLVLPLAWIVPTYLITVPVSCRPNMVAWWSCFTIGYLGGPTACAPVGIFVLLLAIILVRQIIKTKK